MGSLISSISGQSIPKSFYNEIKVCLEINTLQHLFYNPYVLKRSQHPMRELLLFTPIFQMSKVRPEQWSHSAKACNRCGWAESALEPRLSGQNDKASWYGARSFHLWEDGGHGTTGHQLPSPNIPPRETPTSLLPAVSYTHSHDSVKLSCFPARTLFLQGSEVLMLGGWGGWGKGVAGKKSVHKQLKDIRFLKNILLPPHGGLQILVEGRTDARRYSVAGM